MPSPASVITPSPRGAPERRARRPVSASDGPSSEIVGREAELEAVARWLRGTRPALLEIAGEAGIGKTTLWEEAVRLARLEGWLVLECRPTEVEVAVSYGALASLLEPALAAVAGSVALPRLHALEGALRLRAVPAALLDETAVALGALSVLRAAGGQRPVVVAVDDAQWLDASSRVVLTYALRNLRADDDVSVLLAIRDGEPVGGIGLSGSVVATSAERIRPGPLSVGAVHRVVHRRFGATLSRPRLVRLHAISGGNPLHAIELFRVVAEADPREEALEVAGSLADVLRARVAPLSSRARRLLVAVAAAGDVRPGLLARLADPAELDEAVGSGILVLVAGRVRFSHPLLASTVYGDAGELLRTRVHEQLAGLVETPEERAYHLALAGGGPDETVASALEEAAASACQRGACSAGAALYERAAHLTPPDEEHARSARLSSGARAHLQAGEPERARELLEAVSAGGSPARFSALCQLGRLLDETVGGDVSLAAFQAALETDDPSVASQAHRGLAQALTYVGNAALALGHADAAVDVAEPLRDRTHLVYALAMQALVRKIAGHPEWHAPLERALALEAEIVLPELDGCPSAFEADICRLLHQLDDARLAYDRMLGRATERGDVPTEAWCRFGLAAVEIAAGRLDAAVVHGDELADLADQTALLRLPALRVTAQLAALRGDVVTARTLLDTVVATAEPGGELHNLRAALQLQGSLHLSLGEPDSALLPLGRARAIAGQMGVREPGMLISLLDEVEALAAVGDPDAAAAVLEAFEHATTTSPSEWIPPLVGRAHGLVAAARRDLGAARATLERAVAAEGAVPMPLERARTRLALGRVQRRSQQRAAAHATLGEALARFEELGAWLWAARAREELGRIGGRAPARDDLTPTEGRIARLVAEGRTNREVAVALFVTQKTVESALTRVYRKLGVRSRTELARHLRDRP